MSNENTKALNILINKTQSLIDSAISKLKFDKTYKTIIWKINEDDTYSINYKGQLYNIPNASGVSLNLGQTVWVKIPYGILKNMYIESVPNAVISGSGGGGSGSGSSYSSTNYKLTEHRIGTWMDGKPLYQTCIVFENGKDFVANTDITNDLFSTIDNIIGGEVYREVSDSYTQAFCRVDTRRLDDSTIRFYVCTTATPWYNVSHLFIRYTKIGDRPNSSDDNFIGESNILYGTDYPSNDIGKNGYLYYRYEEVKVIDGYVDSGLGWYAKEEYVRTTTDRLCTINGRGYYKNYDGAAVVAVYTPASHFTAPGLLSTISEYVSMRSDAGGPHEYEVSFEHEGLTWYFRPEVHGWENGLVSNDIVNLGTIEYDDKDKEQAIQTGIYILEQAGVINESNLIGSTAIRVIGQYIKIKDNWIHYGGNYTNSDSTTNDSGNSGFRTDVVFEGEISAAGEYRLQKSIDNYDMLYVGGWGYTSTANNTIDKSQFVSQIILKRDYYKQAVNSVGWTFLLHATYGDTTRRIAFGFPNDTTIKVDSATVSTITTIYGIKFGSSTGGGEIGDVSISNDNIFEPLE